MIEIKPLQKFNAQVRVPGSKSYSHRMLIASALSTGTCRVRNVLQSEDIQMTTQALIAMGIPILAPDADGVVEVQGQGGRIEIQNNPIYLANSGTSMRLLTGIAGLSHTPCTLTGTPRMGERPIQDLLDGLVRLGIRAVSEKDNGCPPVTIQGGSHVRGGATTLKCGISSQFLSALLLMGPLLPEGIQIAVTQGPVSKPYIDMTVNILRAFGIEISRQGDTHYNIPGAQRYVPGAYEVEADGSQAGYFWAAAAISKGATVKVLGIDANSSQGDVGLCDILGKMGAIVEKSPGGIAVTGADLQAVDVNMADMPDVVPTLAVVAAYARGNTIIREVGHLRAKESDRLQAVIDELGKMGVQARNEGDDLIVAGGSPRGATIETYDDHRIAMSFSVAGLRTPGMRILEEGCVAKSFPEYWKVFESLYP